MFGAEKLPPYALKIKLGKTPTTSGFVNSIRNDKEETEPKLVMKILVGLPQSEFEPFSYQQYTLVPIPIEQGQVDPDGKFSSVGSL